MTPPRATGYARTAKPLDRPKTSLTRTRPNAPIGSAVATTNQPADKPVRAGLTTGIPPAAAPPPLSEEDGVSAIADSRPILVDPSITDLQKEPQASPLQKSRATASRQKSRRTSESLPRIEADLKTTMQQSPEMRDLERLIQRYQRFVDQTNDSTFAQYATARVKQLKNLDQIRKAKSRFAADAEEIDAYRARMGAERMKIMRARAEAAMVKYDLEGELRRSYAFAPEKRRYRLVDPERQATIAYIDVPVDVQADVEHMIGRFVGIRVSGRRYSQAARIPIAVAASITDLTLRRDGEALESSKSTADRNNSTELANSAEEAAQENQPPEAAPAKTAVAAGSEDDGDQ